jgi:hypothetical protein
MKVFAVFAETDMDANNYLMGIYSTEEKALVAITEGISRVNPIYEPSIVEWEIDAPIEDY